MKQTILYFITFIVVNSALAQSIENSIDAEDAWGAWMVKGTTKAWVVDQIPERARLWDYTQNKVLVTIPLKEDVISFNVMNDGSLAYISHNELNEYIVLTQEGEESSKKFKSNAPAYYIHPDGQFFFGSTFDGFITYTLKENKISNSKLNESITNYSRSFVETLSPQSFFRNGKDVIQKIDISDDGKLSVARAFDKDLLLMSEQKNEFVMMTSAGYKKYSLPDLELKTSKNWPNEIDFVDAVYNSEKQVIYYSGSSQINTLDLATGEVVKGIDVDGDLQFKDRIGDTVIAYSASQSKFYIVKL